MGREELALRYLEYKLRQAGIDPLQYYGLVIKLNDVEELEGLTPTSISSLGPDQFPNLRFEADCSEELGCAGHLARIIRKRTGLKFEAKPVSGDLNWGFHLVYQMDRHNKVAIRLNPYDPAERGSKSQ